MRAAYANAREWLVFQTVSATEWEGVYGSLANWDDPVALGKVVACLERIKAQIADYFESGRARDARGIAARMNVQAQSTVVVVTTAAVYRAVKRRLAELALARDECASAVATG